MSSFLVPSPAPTVTVTETVVVTPPAPTVTVQMPADTFDVWQDIILTGDFVGALLGVVGAIAVTYWLIQRERHARLDERRRDQVSRLSNALRSLAFGTPHADPAVITAALNEIAGAGAPLAAPTKNDRHEEFRVWLISQLKLLSVDWLNDLRATDKMPTPDKVEARTKLSLDIVRLLANVERWGANPDSWSPLPESGAPRSPSQ